MYMHAGRLHTRTRMSTATKEVITTRLRTSEPPMVPPINAPEVSAYGKGGKTLLQPSLQIASVAFTMLEGQIWSNIYIVTWKCCVHVCGCVGVCMHVWVCVHMNTHARITCQTCMDSTHRPLSRWTMITCQRYLNTLLQIHVHVHCHFNTSHQLSLKRY